MTYDLGALRDHARDVANGGRAFHGERALRTWSDAACLVQDASPVVAGRDDGRDILKFVVSGLAKPGGWFLLKSVFTGVHRSETTGVCAVFTPTVWGARLMWVPLRSHGGSGLTLALVRGSLVSDWSIDADGQPVLVPRSPVSGVETARNGPEIGQNVSEIGPSPIPAPARDCRIVVRVTPEFMGWSQGLADHLSLNVTQSVIQGLIRLAEGSGYHHKIPTRYVPKNPSRRRSYPRPSYS